jgi:hypothetical protein
MVTYILMILAVALLTGLAGGLPIPIAAGCDPESQPPSPRRSRRSIIRMVCAVTMLTGGSGAFRLTACGCGRPTAGERTGPQQGLLGDGMIMIRLPSSVLASQAQSKGLLFDGHNRPEARASAILAAISSPPAPAGRKIVAPRRRAVTPVRIVAIGVAVHSDHGTWLFLPNGNAGG